MNQLREDRVVVIATRLVIASPDMLRPTYLTGVGGMGEVTVLYLVAVPLVVVVAHITLRS